MAAELRRLTVERIENVCSNLANVSVDVDNVVEDVQVILELILDSVIRLSCRRCILRHFICKENAGKCLGLHIQIPKNLEWYTWTAFIQYNTRVGFST